MPQKHVEIIRRGTEAWARRDLQEMVRDIDPKAVIYRADPDGATYRGPEGFLQALAEWSAALNDEQLLLPVRQTGVGERSGAPFDADLWFIYTFSGSKVVHLGMFLTKEEALEDAAKRRSRT